MPPFANSFMALLGPLAIVVLLLSSCQSAPTEEEAEALWAASAHADAEARAFTRWNEEDPAEIPVNCAKCHSTIGYHDFLGVDGSTPGQVDTPSPVGTTVECEACHNEVSSDKDSVQMPSAIELFNLSPNSDCMECHQGRASGVQVAEAIAGLPADTVNTEISAPSIHNSPAGPMLYGSEARGGYEYEGKDYAKRYSHVADFDTCLDCHDAHDLSVDARQCNACHIEAVDMPNVRNIRTSSIDYDGDGDTTEGILREIETLEGRLLIAMERYTAETEGVEPIVFNGRITNAAGEPYSTWTPRLLRAAHNYQFSKLSSGGYVHHPHYVIQLLHDSIDDLGGILGGMNRPE